jgi:hypothetical protein
MKHNLIEVRKSDKKWFRERCMSAFSNRRRKAIEKVRKEVIKYTAERKALALKKNKSLITRIGLRSVDEFPQDEMASYFFDLFLDLYNTESISWWFGYPIWDEVEIENAPDWWCQEDFVFLYNFSFIMDVPKEEVEILNLASPVGRGSLMIDRELYQKIMEWSNP